MEIGQQPRDDAELEPWMDEHVRERRAAAHPAVTTARRILQRARRRRPYGDHAASGVPRRVDRMRRGIGDLVWLRIDDVVLDMFGANGLEGPIPDVERDARAFHSGAVDRLQKRRV